MIAELITEGFATCLAFGIGTLVGDTHRAKEEALKRLILDEPDTSNSVWCTCTHGKGLHAHKRGACKYNSYDKKGSWTGRCHCVAFVADPKSSLEEPKNEEDLQL